MKYSSSALYFSSSFSHPSLVIIATLFLPLSPHLFSPTSWCCRSSSLCFASSFLPLSPHRLPAAISTLWKHSCWLAEVSARNLSVMGSTSGDVCSGWSFIMLRTNKK